MSDARAPPVRFGALGLGEQPSNFAKKRKWHAPHRLAHTAAFLAFDFWFLEGKEATANGRTPPCHGFVRFS